MPRPSEPPTLLSDCCLTVEGAALAEKHRRFYIRVLDYVYRVKGRDPCKPSLSQLFGVITKVQRDSEVIYQLVFFVIHIVSHFGNYVDLLLKFENKFDTNIHHFNVYSNGSWRIYIESFSTGNYFKFLFHCKLNENANIANFLYHGKIRMFISNNATQSQSDQFQSSSARTSNEGKFLSRLARELDL